MSFVDLDHAMEWCENRILEAENLLSVDTIPFPKLLEQENFPDPEVIPRLLKSLSKVMVLKGDYVFRQGDPSDAMYFISSGAVNVQLELEGKRAIRLKRMGPGTVFGEMGIYATAPRSASIVADEDSVLYRLSSRTLEKLQQEDPLLASAVHRFVVNLLAGRVFDANAKVRDLFQ